MESARFAAVSAVVDEESAREKTGGGRPEFWEMVFWWTRKPLIGARSIVAAALLGPEASVADFYRVTGLDSEKVPHRVNPRVPQGLRERFLKVKLLDPFAGFGSIPLEAVRLGVGEVVAVELLPSAYVFLKAVLEIPKWAVDEGLARELVEDAKKWGEWVVKELREDPDIKELYDEDAAVYIGTWEVECPFCGRYTPLVGNWWLARVRDSSTGRYTRLAWMEPVAVGDRVEVRVVDLNKELGSKTIAAEVSEGTVKTTRGSYRVPEANIDARSQVARCLHCNRVMPGRGDQWYVKEALRSWNQALEKYLNGEITLEDLKKSKARPRLLVKVKVAGKDLEFEPATAQDDDKLWRALVKLRQMWGDPDIPTEPIPPYGNIGGGLRFPVHIIDKWHQLFNPRQLLTLVKLVKLVREAGRRVEEEKLREGWDREKAHKYAEAVTTYLAIALIKYADFNSIVNRWNPGWLKFEESFSVRGIAMTWNWADSLLSAQFTGTWSRNLENSIDGLSYLVSAVSGSPSRVRVLLDDATVLGKLEGERFDLIVTDPPYRDDVAYAELSDFYYVWLKRALSDVDAGALKPRFDREAFFECLDEECKSYVEVRTQWEKFAPLEVSVSEGRARFFKELNGVEAGSDADFVDKLGRAFAAISRLLKDDGLVVTYYAHTSPEAWAALLEAGWKKAGLMVTAAFALATESEQRVTARGKVALDASVVVAWRKPQGEQRLMHVSEARRRALEEAAKAVEEAVKGGATPDINLFLRSLSAVLSVFTSSKLVPERETHELVQQEIFPLALRGLVEGIFKHAGLERPLDPYSSSYLALKVTTRAEGGKVEKKGFKRGRVDRTYASLLGVFGGLRVDNLVASGILKKVKEELELFEPEPAEPTASGIARALEVLLSEKRVDPSKPDSFKTPVDVLHYLEMKALQLTSEQFKKLVEELKARVPKVYDAINLARVLYAVLPEGDPERVSCMRVLHHLGLLGLERGDSK
ncbi:DUF1156 domain-containing protein [Thermogladius sp. KZ2Tp1]